MPVLATQPSRVLVLTGRHLSPERVKIPNGATAVWCGDLQEALDHARRSRPSCIILDAAALDDARAGLAALRRAIGHAGFVALVGGPACSDADCMLPEDGDLANELPRFVRFCLGERMRAWPRYRADGWSVELATEPPLPLEAHDVSEQAIRVAAHPGAPTSGDVVLRIRVREEAPLLIRAHATRRCDPDPSIVVYRFGDLSSRNRAFLRTLFHRGEPAARSRELPCERSGIVGQSPAIRNLLATLEHVAPTDATVLLLGETGTGKELVARAIHEGSSRVNRPFVAVNCAALPEALVESELFGHEAGSFTGATRRKIGRIEQAAGGTLFLDEIGDLPAPAQAKLLRALQERVIERIGGSEPIRVDVRLVAATNQDLRACMAQRSFRRDLFFRLNVIPLKLPPLRERPEDIPVLVRHFLARAQQRMGKRGIGLSEQALADLQSYRWPGNVRELENLCTRVTALVPSGSTVGHEQLDLCDVDAPLHAPLPVVDLHAMLDFCEREIVRRVLERNRGNRTRAARDLGITRQALQHRLVRLQRLDRAQAAAK
jgi:two-component system, NtrC family, response regulator HydG